MSFRHLLLALLVVTIWGFNFVVTRLALDHYPPLLLVALRFALAAIPCFFVRPPNVPLLRMIGIGMTMFVGQYAFLYLSLAMGFPAGLSSVALQVQAFMTVLLAALMLGERPRRQQLLGTLVAFAGLGAIALATANAGIPLVASLLILASAGAWALGNVWMRGAGQYGTFSMVVWLSLVPPLPMLALSLIFEGSGVVAQAALATDWWSFSLLAYIALASTLVGFGIWGLLIKNYPASMIAPLTLLVPITGAGSAALVLGETFGGGRVAGMALVLAGLACVTLPARWLPRWVSGKANVAAL